MSPIPESDLIINPDGSIYHLNLLPEDIGDTVITVGDPDRVTEVSKYFDRIETRKAKREFITHTGWLNRKRISVISTGIGTDNIDIVLNELDALVNINFQTRQPKESLKSLDIIRIGTSGTIRSEIPVGSVLISEYALGLDSLMHYYQAGLNEEEKVLNTAVQEHFSGLKGIFPYITSADKSLVEKYGSAFSRGITVTAPGFYAPQGRKVRITPAVPDLISLLASFSFKGKNITNLEMETAGIYALAKALGHRALSVNAILASRVQFEFSKNSRKVIEKTIQHVLQCIA